MPFLLQLPTSSKLRSLFKYLSSLESLPGYQLPVAEHLENTKSQEEPELICSWQKFSLYPASAQWCLTSNSWQRIFLSRGTASYTRGYLAPSEREGFPFSEMHHLTPSCFISDTFFFHGFSFYLVTKPCVFAWSHLSLKMATKEISTTFFFLFKHAISLWTNTTKNPHPKPWLCFRCY